MKAGSSAGNGNMPVKGMIKNFKNKYLKKVGSMFSKNKQKENEN